MNYKAQSINNVMPDYDEYVISLDNSKRDGGSLTAPKFRLNISGMIGKPEIYDSNSIYLVPLFFYGMIPDNDTSVFVNNASQYWELRCNEVVSMNHLNKDLSQNVICKGFLEDSTQTNLMVLKYENIDNVNNKYLRVDPQILNNNEIELELYDVLGSRIEIGSDNQTALNRHFKFEFKIVMFKKQKF